MEWASTEKSLHVLDADVCYRAVMARDGRFDGRFFVCVSSTGIYCRPVCPAKTPRADKCRFVRSAAEAEALGYRSCLRCRPETAPGTPAWVGTGATVTRALRLIEEGALDEGSVPELAARLGLGDRQLRRLFLEHLGATPLDVAANRRLMTAKLLLDETSLPVSEIAFMAGFRSLRRFNDVIRLRYGVPPTELRARNMTNRDGVELRLGYRPPFSWERLTAYLGFRAVPGVEAVENGVYQRSFRIGKYIGVLTVSHDPAHNSLRVSVRGDGVVPIRQIGARLRRLFDLDADPLSIHRALARHELMRPFLKEAEGLRIPGAFDGFELAVRAVLGQQVSVKGMVTMSARLAGRCGTRLPAQMVMGTIDRLFPLAEQVAQADLSGMGLTGARIATLKRLADAAIAEPTLFLPKADLATTIAHLKALPGIGDWTAHYIALRAVGEPDAFPAGDLGLRKAFGRSVPLRERDVKGLAEVLRPWRGYAAMLIWQAGPMGCIREMDEHAAD